MLKSLQTIKGSRVKTFEKGKDLGKVRGVVTNSQGTKVMAAILRFPLLWIPGRVLALVDAVEYGEQLIVTREKENIVRPEEIAYLPELIEKRTRPLDAKALDPEGNYLGRVTDVIFETQTSAIHQFHLSDPTRQTRILPPRTVIKIEHQTVIFKDPKSINLESPAGRARDRQLA